MRHTPSTSAIVQCDRDSARSGTEIAWDVSRPIVVPLSDSGTSPLSGPVTATSFASGVGDADVDVGGIPVDPRRSNVVEVKSEGPKKGGREARP